MKTQKNKTTTKAKQTITATTKTPKETHKGKTKQKQNIKKRPTSFFRMTFHMYFTCFFIKISWAQSMYVIEIMLSVKCRFFLKGIVFIDLFKAISFSILLTFLFSFLWIYRHNLKISRMWLIKILLSSENALLLTESRIPRTAVCGVKVGNIKVFWKTLN